MERIPPVRTLAWPVLASLAAAALLGCSAGASATATPAEEEMYKHPTKGDVSKLPPDAFKPKGPAFIGEPTKASGASSQSVPPAATGR